MSEKPVMETGLSGPARLAIQEQTRRENTALAELMSRAGQRKVSERLRYYMDNNVSESIHTWLTRQLSAEG